MTITPSTSFEQVGTGVPAVIKTQNKFVNSAEGATRTLLASESGMTCLFDRAAGIVYTLPATANNGTYFDFLTTVSITSNAAKVIKIGRAHV